MITIREATIDDASGIARVRVDGWRAAYAGLMDQRILDGMDAEREAARRAELWAAHHADRRGRDLVAVTETGEVAGWAVTGPHRGIGGDLGPGWGELYALYAHPDHWSTGVGHRLMVEAEAALRDAGFVRAALWVLAGNERAASFYERHGWVEDGATYRDEREIAGDTVVLTERRRRRDLSV